MGHDTSERRKYPFQYARGAIGGTPHRHTRSTALSQSGSGRLAASSAKSKSWRNPSLRHHPSAPRRPICERVLLRLRGNAGERSSRWWYDAKKIAQQIQGIAFGCLMTCARNRVKRQHKPRRRAGRRTAFGSVFSRRQNTKKAVKAHLEDLGDPSRMQL